MSVISVTVQTEAEEWNGEINRSLSYTFARREHRRLRKQEG